VAKWEGGLLSEEEAARAEIEIEQEAEATLHAEA
jgi:hypothetical protein